MSTIYATGRSAGSSARTAPFARSWAGLAVLVHGVVWSVGPSLFIGNLNADTLEAAYWARDFALGYSKHPPVTSWIIDLALRLGHAAPILSLMIASQATVAITAYFVWRLMRMYASPGTATLAVMLYLVSPAATFYAVQMNHNSVLAPFWAAAMYFGLAYLENGRWRDAVALGVVAGVGILTKYEILFILVCLVALALCVPRFRPAFKRPASYVSIVIALVLILPHIYWLYQNHWPSVSRALGADKVVDVDTLNDSAQNALVGQFTLFFMPAVLLLSTFALRTEDRAVLATPSRLLIGAVLAFGPSLVLLIGGAATAQVIKPLWTLPLTASAAVGLAVLFPAGEDGRGLREITTAKATIGVSVAILAGFFGYLFIVDAINKPLTSYSADTKQLSRAIETLWKSRQPSALLECIVIDDIKLSASPVLWLADRPKFVDYSVPDWSKPNQVEDCQRVGGVALITGRDDFLAPYANACVATRTPVHVPTTFGISPFTWSVDLVYIAPNGQNCADAMAH